MGHPCRNLHHGCRSTQESRPMTTQHSNTAIVRRRRRAALALAAIGTPLVAATPATADGQAGADGVVQAQGAASSSAGVQNGAQAQPESSAPPPTAPNANNDDQAGAATDAASPATTAQTNDRN